MILGYIIFLYRSEKTSFIPERIKTLYITYFIKKLSSLLAGTRYKIILYLISLFLPAGPSRPPQASPKRSEGPTGEAKEGAVLSDLEEPCEEDLHRHRGVEVSFDK